MTGDIFVSSPAVANGVVYLGSWEHKVYAFGSPSNNHSASIMNWIFPVLAVAISVICACILLALFVRRRKRKRQLVYSAVQKNPQKPMSISSIKVEVIDDAENFLFEKGLRKKCWVAALEFKKSFCGRFCFFSRIESHRRLILFDFSSDCYFACLIDFLHSLYEAAQCMQQNAISLPSMISRWPPS